jgi:hypothetical protein
VTVAISNGTAVTASNVAAAVGAQNGNFDSGDGLVGIRSKLVGRLSTLGFDKVADRATGEIGVGWGIEADHCLRGGSCGGGDHYVDATAALVVAITVLPPVASWELQIGVQSFGNLNAVVDGGTLPACTSVVSAPTFEFSMSGGATADLSYLLGDQLSIAEAEDCTQDSDWFKDENAEITVSGTGSGKFELRISQSASVRSARQTDRLAIKNGSDTCFRAGMDPGYGVRFLNACDYPGLAAASGNRDGDLLLGNEENDGGLWITDRVGGAAIELTAITFEEPIEAAGAR